MTYAEKISGADRTLDPAAPAEEQERVVRALQPHIGARLPLPDGSSSACAPRASAPTAPSSCSRSSRPAAARWPTPTTPAATRRGERRRRPRRPRRARRGGRRARRARPGVARRRQRHRHRPRPRRRGQGLPDRLRQPRRHRLRGRHRRAPPRRAPAPTASSARRAPRAESANGRRWVVDGIDGTFNFLSGIPHWCVAVGLEEAGAPVAGAVYDPTADELFAAGPGRPTTRNGTRTAVRTGRGLESAAVATFLERDVDRDLVLGRLAGAVGVLRAGGAGRSSSPGSPPGASMRGRSRTSPPWDWVPGAALVRHADGEAVVLGRRRPGVAPRRRARPRRGARRPRAPALNPRGVRRPSARRAARAAARPRRPRERTPRPPARPGRPDDPRVELAARAALELGDARPGSSRRR